MLPNTKVCKGTVRPLDKSFRPSLLDEAPQRAHQPPLVRLGQARLVVHKIEPVSPFGSQSQSTVDKKTAGISTKSWKRCAVLPKDDEGRVFGCYA